MQVLLTHTITNNTCTKVLSITEPVKYLSHKYKIIYSGDTTLVKVNAYTFALMWL